MRERRIKLQQQRGYRGGNKPGDRQEWPKGGGARGVVDPRGKRLKTRSMNDQAKAPSKFEVRYLAARFGKESLTKEREHAALVSGGKA